jgi:PAS domain S-box-containing protein
MAKRQSRRHISSFAASRVAIAYAVAGIVYILVSDSLVSLVTTSPEQATFLNVAKGVVFILTTSLLLFFLLRQKEIIGTSTFTALSRRASDADLIAATLTKDDQDVDLVQAHTALAESEGRLRLIVDAAAEAIVICDERGMILTWNRAAQRMFGRTEEDAIGEECPKLITTPELSDGCKEKLVTVRVDAPAVRFEGTGLRSDGEMFPMEVGIIAVAWGPRVLHTAFIRDITDRVRAAHESERVAAIVNASPDAIFAVTPEGIITSWNPAAERTFGYNADAARGSLLERLVARKESATIHWLLDSIARGIPIESSPLDCVRSVDEIFQAFVSVSPIREKGAVTGAAVIIRDASEQLKPRDRVRDAETLASLGRLAASVGHQFNNVLMGILPFVDVLKRNELPPQAMRAVEQIAKSVERGRRVTAEIQTFTRASEAPARRSVAAKKWFEGLLSDIDEVLGPGISLDLEVQENLALAADPAKLRHVFINLAANARDAMPGGGRFSIIVRDSPVAPPHAHQTEEGERGWAEILVSDTGEGIDEESQRRIFEPLFAKHRGGSGLELATVQQIVRSHGGAIDVTSTRGKGTTYRIVLPRAGAPLEEQAAAMVMSPPGTIRRVLLVEDDAHVAVGLTQALNANGMHVDVVHTGARVVHAVRTFTPEVVVLDIRLPDANGFDVYREIASTWPDLPVIFSTGHADEFDLQAAEPLKQPHVELLRKPYPTEALLAAMDRVTAKKKAAV